MSVETNPLDTVSDRDQGDDMPKVSAEIPDWSREKCRRLWDPARRTLKAFRDYERCRGQRGLLRAAQRKWCVLRHRVWSAITGVEIPLGSDIGGGLSIPHPNGIVIHRRAKIGPNCLIFHQVTIGIGGTVPGPPTIGGQVDIGAGAKILGGIHVGNHAKIGANAVVICDVPEGATAIGVPARVISR